MERIEAWKIVVGGNGGVGKTTFIHRYVNNEFIRDTKMTIGVQFHSKNISLISNSKTIKKQLLIWDLAGQERFWHVLPQYVTGTVAGIVMFDMSRYDTLVQTDKWFTVIKKNAKPHCPIILVGTKWDIVEKDVVNAIINETIKKSKDDGYDGYAFTSSASGTNVEETMNYLIDLAWKAKSS